MTRRAKILLALLPFVSQAYAVTTSVVDLSGVWKVTGKDLSGEVRLPGTLADHRLGRRWLAKDYEEASDPEQATAMTREYQYLGKAVYSRTFDVDEDGEYELFIERVIWATEPTVDGRTCPEIDVLGAPHVHRLGRLAKGTHRLEVAVDNAKRYGFSGSSHAYGASMQSVWHGMLGKIAVRKVNPLDGIRVKAAGDGKLYLSKIPEGLSPTVEIEGLEVSGVERTGGSAVYSFTRAPELWSDCSPRLYRLRLSDGVRMRELTVGFRTFVAGKGRHHIELNGRKIFTRCNVENCNFARTGSPWMTKEEWTTMIRTLRDEDGINAIRFHTWCPPECAFEAADELGVFLQPECGIWSDGWMGEGVDHVGYGKPVDDFARREFKAISDAYGAHPSFLSLSIGNELGKSEWTEANRMSGEMKAYDDRFLHYFCSAREIMDNDEMVLTHRDFKRQVTIRERLFPKTDWDYEADYAAMDRPTVAHEIGQWPVYPDFDKLIADCDGVIRPYNFERFRAVAVKENALRFLKEYEDASAALNRLIYKEEVESFLRTPSCAGLQLLNIQDYTGQAEALVGWRDPFYELKRPFRDWPAFNTIWGEKNHLARFSKYEWTVGETLTAKLVYRNLSGAALPAGTEMPWSCAGRSGTIRTVRVIEPCEVAEVGVVSIPLDASMTASKQTLVFGTNRWSFWVYPVEEACAFPADVVVTKDFAEMKAALADGKTVLYRGVSRACGRANFKPVYWSTGWFMSKDVIKDHLGTWFEVKNPIFDGFVTEFFTDWQWYELAEGQVIHGLTGLPEPFRPAALSVNDFHSSKFASPLFELGVGKGRLVVCGYDLDKANPSAKRLRAAIAGHLARPAAKDLTRVGLAWLTENFEPVKTVVQKKRVDGIDASRIIYSKDFDWSGRSFTHEFSLDEPENGILEIVFDAKKSQGLARCYIEDHVVNTPGDDGEWVARAMIIREDMLDRKIAVRVQSITPLNVAIKQIRLIRQ